MHGIVRLQRRAGPAEGCLAQRAQPGAHLVAGIEQERLDLVGGLGTGLDRAAAGEHQQPQLAGEPAAVLANRGCLTGQHGTGGVLGIDRVALATAAAPGQERPGQLISHTWMLRPASSRASRYP